MAFLKQCTAAAAMAVGLTLSGCELNKRRRSDSRRTPLGKTKPSESTVKDGAPPFLWKITKNGVDIPSWLLGTAHLGVSLEEALPGKHVDKLTNADCVAIETDLVASQIGPDMGVANIANRNKKELLFLESNDMQMQALAQTIEENDKETEETKLDFEKKILEQYGKTDKRFQDRMDSLPRDKRYFREIIADMADPQKLAAAAELAGNLYRSGDVTDFRVGVYELGPAAHKHLFQYRNNKWMPSLNECLSEGNCFVAVGLGHVIAGPDSLKELLISDGWTVERVTEPSP